MRFNPTKTKCLIKGECPSDEIPKLTMENQVVSVEQEVNYLGVKMSNKSNKSHIIERIGSIRRAFFHFGVLDSV